MGLGKLLSVADSTTRYSSRSFCNNIWRYAATNEFDNLSSLNSFAVQTDNSDERYCLSVARDGLRDTTVRLNVEENQLVNVFGEFGNCLGDLKSA